MAKRVYKNINGVARRCQKMYPGVDDIARKIKKGYIGVNGVARQFWPPISKMAINISFGGIIGQIIVEGIPGTTTWGDICNTRYEFIPGPNYSTITGFNIINDGYMICGEILYDDGTTWYNHMGNPKYDGVTDNEAYLKPNHIIDPNLTYGL